MNIFHVITSIDITKGGPSRSVPDLCNSLAQKEVNICLMTISTSNPYIKGNPNNNFKLKLIAEESFKIEITTILKNDEYDLVHGHGIWNFPIHMMAKLSRRNNIKYLISTRGMLEPWALNAKKWKKKFALWLYQNDDLSNAACLHATSEMEANNLRNLGFKNPIAVIPNGINLSDFSISSTTKNETDNILLFFSRIHPKKGIEVLIDAWSRLEDRKKQNWKIKIVGNGEDKYIRSLQDLILSRKLKNEIEFCGPYFGEAKLKIYQQADLFVLPTYSENFGIVVAEAMACGLPVITTKGAPWEELEIYNAGWWIDIGVDPLVQALTSALRLTDHERKTIGRNGRRLIEEKYSTESGALKMLQLYEWILNKNEKPDYVYY